jgi:hypothetical protein
LVQAVSSEIQVKVEHQDSRVLSSSGSSGANGLKCRYIRKFRNTGVSGSSVHQEVQLLDARFIRSKWIKWCWYIKFRKYRS